MASSTAQSANSSSPEPRKSSDRPPAPPSRARRGTDAHDDFIARQIRRTRWQVKLVDLFSRLVVLVCGVLTMLFLLVLADHWFVSGGLGWTARTVGFVAIAGGAVIYFWLQIVPVLLRPINPLYAAYTIEQARPSARNSLINYVLLKRTDWSLHRAVMGALRRRAADDLAQVDVEHVVDRSPLLRGVYWLLAIVALLSFYKLLSPKDPLRSIGRVMAPWSDLAPPTRVSIDEVQPGSSKAFQGDVLEVSARVRGIEPNEPVTIYYTTDDQQIVDRPIEMRLPDDGYRYRAPLPDDARGLVGSLSYTIVAGDARRGPYRIQVLPAPSVVVERVEYHFPDYTHLASKTVEGQGDLQAIEGTRVVVHARANMPIERAWLDRGCDGRRDAPMRVAGRTARGEWTLTLGPDGQPPEESYQIRFTNHEGFENPRPVRYRIRVFADQPPIVAIRQPESIETDVPADGSLGIAVTTEDPDFALSELHLKLVRGGGGTLATPQLLKGGKPVRGEFNATYRFEPRRWKLAPGETIVFWAEAVDNRRPEPQRSESDHYRLRITSPAAQPPAERLAKNDRDTTSQPDIGGQAPGNRSGKQTGRPGDPPVGPSDEQAAADQQGDSETNDAASDDAEHRAADAADASSGDGSPQQGEAAGMQTSEQNDDKASESDGSQRIDPEANPGDAFETILEEVSRQSDDQQQAAASSDEQPGSDGARQPGDERASAGGERDESDMGDPGQGDAEADKRNEPSSDQQGQGAQGGAAGSKQTEGDGAGSPAASDADRRSGDGASGSEAAKPGGGKANRQKQQNASSVGDGGQPRDGAGNPNEPAAQQGGNRPGQKAEDGQDDQSGPRQRRSGQVDAGRVSRANDDTGDAERRRADLPSEGQGDRAQQRTPGQEPPPTDRQNDASKASGGEPRDAKGNSGAGQSQGNEKGAPEPLEENKPRDKRQSNRDKTADDHGQGEKATSSSLSPKESDSQGGEQGDRSGGGQEGGGQKANAKGTGGAGQNTASDEGGSAAQGSGHGETANRSGNRRPGGASESGSASQADGQGKSASQGGQSAASGGQGQQNQPQPKRGAGGPSKQSGAKGTGSSDGGGQADRSNRQGDGGGGPAMPGAGGASAEGDNGEEPGGDRANLDYARRATQLVIDHLKDQLARDQLDQKLLDKLGWTRADVERFVAQWERMRREAEQGTDSRARSRFNQALRSLGLRPRSTELRGRRGTQRTDLRESQRVPAPLEYREQFEAYTEATARSRPTRRSGEPPASDARPTDSPTP